MGRTETVPFDEVNAAVLRGAIEREARLLGMLQAFAGKVIVGVVVRDIDDGTPAVAPEPEAINPSTDAAFASFVVPPPVKTKAKRGRR